MKECNPALVVVAVSLAILAMVSAFLPPPHSMHYPNLKFVLDGGITLEFVGRGSSDKILCTSTLSRIAKAFQAICRDCGEPSTQCLTELPDELFARVSGEPLDVPSSRLEDGGLITYRAPDPAVALAICQASEKSAAGTNNELPCVPAGVRWNYFPGS